LSRLPHESGDNPAQFSAVHGTVPFLSRHSAVYNNVSMYVMC